MSSSYSPADGVTAIILAAGAGSRMGGRAKCLLRVDEQTLLSRQIDSLRSTGIAEILVVVGHYAAEVSAEARRAGVTGVVTAAGEELADSVRCGLRAAASARVALLCPADLPLLSAEHYALALGQFTARPEGKEIAAPMVAAVPGHPLVISAGAALTALKTFGGAKPRWRLRDSEQTWHWFSDDPAFITDVDTEEDRHHIEAKWGLRLR